jgi:hypothetical protein
MTMFLWSDWPLLFAVSPESCVRGMNDRNFFVLTVGALIVLGCGRPHLVATISPMEATVKAGGVVTLAADQSGFTNEPVMQWWIQESKRANPKITCGMFDYLPKDFTGCPFGFVVYRADLAFPGTAVYHAPPTPGVYHVTVGILQVSEWNSLEERTATAAITVTP